MTEPYLIAHKVRGEAAFDIAERLQCPLCSGEAYHPETSDPCDECSGEGYWWIIPTSGHRARPWWSARLDGLGRYSDIGFILDEADGMPEGWPDHYSINDRPAKPSTEDKAKGRNLLTQLGLARPKPSIVRRF